MVTGMSVGKVGGSSSAGNVGRVSGGPKKTGEAGSFRSLLAANGVDDVEAAAPAQSVHAISSLLAAQETGDALDSNSRGRQRGEQILAQMDNLRLALIDGKIPLDQLERLAKQVQAQRARITDPALSEILDDIDLRAQVELAKYQRG